MSCHVQKYYQSKDGYTEYFILVLYQGREWAVRKRFSDFSKFDEYLRTSGYTINYQLPEKNWWNKFDPTLLTRRLKELQNYLDVLLREELSAQNSLVREFLEVDENMLLMAKKAPLKDGTLAERLVKLVKTMRTSLIGIPSHRESLGDAVAAQYGRNYRENSKYYYRDDSPGGTPRQRSKEHNGSFGASASAASAAAVAAARGNSGSFSGGGFGGVLRIGIGSFSGNVGGVENAAQAVADAARREAFLAQSTRLWLLLGRQTEARARELNGAENGLPVPFPLGAPAQTQGGLPAEQAELTAAAAVVEVAADESVLGGDEDGDVWKEAGGVSEPASATPVPAPAPTPTLAAPAVPAASSASWIVETLSAPTGASSPAGSVGSLSLASLLALHSLESDTLVESLPKNSLTLLAGDPSLCVFRGEGFGGLGGGHPAASAPLPVPVAVPNSSPRSGKVSPRAGDALPPRSPASASSPAVGHVGREQLRRVNSEGKSGPSGPSAYGKSL